VATVTLPTPAADGRERYVSGLTEALRNFEPRTQLLVTGVDWDLYEHLLGVRDESCRWVRISYDRGRLELMSHSGPHERWKRMLGYLLLCAAEELFVPMVCCGNATVRRRDLGRGIEPDDWYYVGATATRMTQPTATRSLDFAHDPPPDLAVEIEVSRSFLDRLGICAALGIPEVWLFDGTQLEVVRLTPGGAYQPAASAFFPSLPRAEVVRFLDMAPAVDDITILRQFRAWVRQTLVPPAAGPTP
jgi:Uma2 family endonuclease